jgi:MtrB/PioB family decaheme-associated outer membrane protein
MSEYFGKCLVAVAALLPSTSGGAWAQAAREATLDLDVAAGARLADVSGSTEKFEEFGEVNDGLVVDRLRLRVPGPTAVDYLELGVDNAAQDDESFRITAGRQGLLQLRVDYQAMPHRFSSGSFLWGGFGTGRLQVPDVVQSQLESAEQTSTERGLPPTDPNTDTTGEDAIQQDIVRGLYQAANGVSFGLDRRRVGAEGRVHITRDWSAWARVRNENRTGARVIGSGSYERWAVGSGLTHTVDRFITVGAELAEPLDHRTFGASVGTGFHEQAWLADVEYTFTQFRNFESVLLWDNPFRISDDVQVAGLDRSRFVTGQLVLPPDSVAHDVTANGAVDLPLHGRLAASVSAGMITQDDAFFPYTRNGAIVATDQEGTPVGSAATAALPASDLDGEVRTLAGTLAASVRPLEPLGVTAKYRAYRYDDRSEEITFPGYAAFGESAWRREKNDVSAGIDALVKNEVFDYWRHEVDLGADYRVSRTVSVAADLAWEGWRFDHLRLDRLDEYAAGVGVVLKPMRNASLKATYRYSDRANDGYLQGVTAENPEARGLLNYNWADRTRHLAEARAQYSPSRLVSLGVIGRFVDEEYGGETEGGTAVDQFRFGRTDLTRWLGSLDVGVNPAERLSLHATYSFEYRKESMANAAKDDGAKATDDFGFTDNFAPENYWSSEILEKVHSVGAAATVQLVPDRLVLDAGYDLSLSAMQIDTENPNGVTATTLANAVANGWPDIENRLHEVFADVAYSLTRNVRAGLRYLYLSYDLDDFAWDPMSPYMAGVSVENTTRFVFTDATYGGYRAHVGTVYVAGAF